MPMRHNRDTAKDSASCRVVWGGDVTPWMPPLIVLTTQNGSSPSHDVMDCVVGDLMAQQLDNRCTRGEICFIDCIQYYQGNTFYQADYEPGGWGGRLRPHNSGRGGAPSSSHFRTIVFFVAELYFALSGLPDLQNQTSTHRDRSMIGVRTWIL